MADSETVRLDAANSGHAVLMSNLLELYIHDMSAAFPNMEIDARGRFGYPKLPLYWSEPDRRFAFIVKLDARIAGFVLATRGSHLANAPEDLDVDEFFVLRQYRRRDIGRQAATLLWNRIPGKWTVRVSEGNSGGTAFWRKVVSDFTQGAATELQRAGTPNHWRVFSFESPADPDGFNAATGK